MDVTDEMIKAFADAAWEKPVEFGGLEMADNRAGLAAVLALVERDHCLEPKGHAVGPLPVVDRCLAVTPKLVGHGDIQCAAWRGHSGPHYSGGTAWTERS